MTYTKEQTDYINAHGGVIYDDGMIYITYKACRKLCKDYFTKDIDRKNYVWLIPGTILLKENVHFIRVNNLKPTGSWDDEYF